MKQLIAPNGKSSNLTPEQWKLVRTPQFKAWFGDWENDPENASKVVDENGEPLVVYHGTDNKWWVNNKFIFNPKLEGKSSETKRGKFGGVYFASNINVAKTYGKNILGVFLKIKNSILIKGKNKYIQDVYDCEEKNIGCSNEDVIIKNTIDTYPNNYFFQILQSDEIDIKKFFATDIFIVRESNNIKLADGTNTTFDGSNPDIRFAEGGEVNSNSFMKWFVQWYKPISNKVNIAFSFSNHFHPFKEKNVVILDVFEKIDQSIDAKPYLQEIVQQADKYGVVIYLEPKPRHKHFQDNLEKKKKISKDYLVGYYQKFGFELTANKLLMKRKPNNPDIRFAEGGKVEKLIMQGVVDLKMYDTTTEHSKVYGFECSNPLYIQRIFVNENERNNGIGVDVLKYINEYAKENNHDLIFGHIQQKAEPSVDAVKGMLRKNGYSTIEGNNDFYKYIDLNTQFAEGGKTKRTMKRIKRGGITYGKSHAEGGIPVKNQSTGDMLEVEGGEGIVNKRSMASKSIVTLNGKKMNICQAVSELNQMEGGVKFSCEDVNDRQFIKAMAKGGELDRGTRTEQEHIQVLKDLYAKRITPKEASERIAKDHLKEDSRYYSKLAKMEGKMADGGKTRKNAKKTLSEAVGFDINSIDISKL